jgi:hypothetical protein
MNKTIDKNSTALILDSEIAGMVVIHHDAVTGTNTEAAQEDYIDKI